MLFDSETSGCKEQNQSPINLSQSVALPCKRLCDWKVDDRAVRTASVRKIANSVLSLINFSESMTASFNADRYTCSQIDLYNMAQHSIENSYGDLELVATFTSPGKKTVKMSVIINSSARNTKSPSIEFLNAFVPHASDGDVGVTFDGSWSLQNILPADLSYFVYAGRDFVTCAEECTWIVYKNPVDIDSSTYARMVGSTVSNRVRKPLQQLTVGGQEYERHMYYSDAVDTNPAYMKRDGKVYMRCRRLKVGPGGTKRTETFVGSPEEEDEETPEIPTQVKSGGLTSAVTESSRQARALQTKNTIQMMKEWFERIGGVYGLLLAVSVIGMSVLLWTFYREMPKKLFGLALWLPTFVHCWIFGPCPPPLPNTAPAVAS